jgi:lipopolysaccharide transport system ATP-binding protein
MRHFESMTQPAIRVEHLGKQYQIGAPGPRYATFREALTKAALAPWRRFRQLSGVAQEQSIIWALRDVSFEVQPGEVVGIIGRNGAGKSTLLKILSQITEPTEGRVTLNGRVASLLEVGTGFHPELTGRENVFLNGSILGMSRREIARKFEEIVDFAGVERFIDTPVKHYSSGMQVRLAFAVAAHLEPEILLVDEVLAVGDIAFQKKCLGKIGQVAVSGRTVLLVSHNLAAVEALCTFAILLSEGNLIAQGNTKTVLRTYLKSVNCDAGLSLNDRSDRQGSGAVRFVYVSLADDRGQRQASFQCGHDSEIVLVFENRLKHDITNLHVALGIDNELGQRVLLLDSTLLGTDLSDVAPGTGMIHFAIPKLSLLPGRYSFNVFSAINGIIADWIQNAGSFDVEGGDYFGTGRLPRPGQAVFLTDHTIRYERVRARAYADNDGLLPPVSGAEDR